MTKGLKKTLALGAVATGAALFLFKTERGRAFKKSIEEHVTDMYGTIRERLGDIKDVTRDMYERVVETTVDEYTRGKDELLDIKDTLTGGLKKRWQKVLANSLYENVVAELRDVGAATKTTFYDAVDEVVTRYAKTKHIAEDEVADLRSSLRKRWSMFNDDREQNG